MTTTNDFRNIPKAEQRKARALANQPIVRHKTPTGDQFAKLTPAEQRVAIARDVLKHLAARKFVAAKGHYLRLFHAETLPDEFIVDEVSAWAPKPWQVPELSLLGATVVNGNSCCVCALGAVFAAACDLTPVQLRDVEPDAADQRERRGLAERMHDRLSPYFALSQLTLMECAFERSTSFEYEAGLSSQERGRACDFGCAVARSVPEAEGSTVALDPKVQKVQDERVLRAIMQNIIDNDGTFIP